jgi:hypothetical protein
MAHTSASHQADSVRSARLEGETTNISETEDFTIGGDRRLQGQELLAASSISVELFPSSISPVSSAATGAISTDGPTIRNSLSKWGDEEVKNKCRKMITQLKDGTESADSLFLLLSFIDQDCIRSLAGKEPTSDRPLPAPALDQGLIAAIVSALFEKCHHFHGHTDAPKVYHHELRLRALVSALTLLRYHGNTHIQHQSWKELQDAKSKLLKDARLPQSTKLGTCSYLAQLANEYLGKISFPFHSFTY